MKTIALASSLTSDFGPQMAEQFANERKNIRFKSGQMMIFGVLFGECGPRLPKLPRKQKTKAKKAQ